MTQTRTADPAWLESQYNNRARVPEHPAILARWAADSERVRRASRCVLNLPYGQSAQEALDIFLPVGTAGPAPVIVFIHGGWWRSLDKADHSFVAPALTAAGAMVVVPNYALCPAVTIDEIALQMTRALAWVWRHAAAHGGDPRRIVVAGHSAGGHLAALLLTCDWKRVGSDLPPALLQGGLAISGVFDLDPLRRTPSLQRDLQLTPTSVRRLSPARLPPPRWPLMAVAGADESSEFMRHLGLIRAAWGEGAVPVSEAVPSTNHFTVLDELARPGSRVHDLALRELGLTRSHALSRRY